MKNSIILVAVTVILAMAVFIGGRIRGPEVNAPNVRVGVDINAPHGESSVEIIAFMSRNLYDRFPFSYREREAALWIYDELVAAGFEDVRIQDFSFGDVRGEWPFPSMIALNLYNSSPFVNMGLRADRGSQNVVLTLPGQSERQIIIGAHYDTVFLPGASDNASGVALLIENAVRMREFERYFTLTYVFFGAEEAGLYGARYFAKTFEHHDDVLFMVNADVLIEGPYLFYMAGYDTEAGDCPDANWRRISRGVALGLDENFEFADFSPGTNEITDSWDSLARDMYYEHGIAFFPAEMGAFGPSDQLAFLPFGHTVMFLNGLDKTEEWHVRTGHETWWDFMELFSDMTRVLHTPQDCFDYIEAAWPGKMQEIMHGFNIFLEAMLLAENNGGAN
ncbi:MAG: M28 family peptidase [Defluviitaleaceae bacterium]|nr:M28 family peptidase [Defluviitaleaceae bacterium]